ncbi:hypothetical protein SLEP1_g47126 [Rubroshorea leprosula]|uniref:Zinc finger PMZ-type domain-containing protein n=1 Tax=Rubroshorea leprosula TaxID=152421 RepID=A0AAV5LQC9_9ROSI|nr:hypothetical protein SLEP1_g47126 [Rubroshorea leprosula]
MEEINKLNSAAKEHLMQYDPKYWCKTFLDTHCKCDAVDNNMSETFNGFILDARQKAAMSLLEDLRVWQLNGIPCRHAMLAIQHREENFEDYVHLCYRRQAYINTYKHCIIPLDGMERWEEIGMPALDPPVERKTTGRPKKKRHLEDCEISNGSNISRKEQAEESSSTQANVVNNIPIIVEMPIGDARVARGVEMQLQPENQQVDGGVQLQMQPKKELLAEGVEMQLHAENQLLAADVQDQTSNAQRFARLRATEQCRLDEMELANWSALIQAMGSIDDGNNCP